ncbi:MAG: thioredoxin domain-containing protein [Alphaproteobacteria bacterium]|nr:thioredoxin domain-containing protein [Alphaproteobacteria bacterium]
MRRIHLVLPLTTLLFAAGAAGATGAIAADAPDKQALDQAIRSYLLEHPEVIIESLEKFEQKQRAARDRASADALASRQDELYNHPMTPVTGNPKGDVTIVEFFDYQCGYCKRAMQTVLEVQKEDPSVRIAWKELPILGPASKFAARAAMAAERQDKYLDFHVAVMGNRGPLTPDTVFQLAKKAGISVDRLKRDMADPAIEKYLQDTLQLAQQLGINGTPGFVIGGKLVPGAIEKDQLKELIAEARKPG